MRAIAPRQPVSSGAPQLLFAFDTTDPGGEFRAEQGGICSFRVPAALTAARLLITVPAAKPMDSR